MNDPNDGYRPHDLPTSYLGKWQNFLDRVASAYQVPSALVMRVWPAQIEVLLSSASEGNPYEEHERADLGTGLYCETVMASRQELAVPNALENPAWRNNPDVKLNMISYLGVPLVWPDDSIFGTLCVLDSHTRHFPLAYREALWRVKNLIEQDFAVFCRGGPDQPLDRTAQEWERDIEAVVGFLPGDSSAA